jgi:hypothetical protein
MLLIEFVAGDHRRRSVGEEKILILRGLGVLRLLRARCPQDSRRDAGATRLAWSLLNRARAQSLEPRA